MNLNNKKILIIRLSSIGDTIHSLPIAAALKKAYPDCIIHWLVEKASAVFIENNPVIDRAIVIDKPFAQGIQSFSKLRHLRKILSKEKYDLAIDIQGLFKSGLLTYLSGATKTIGFKNSREFADRFLTDKIDVGNIFDEKEHVIEKNLKLLKHLGIEDPQLDQYLPEVDESTKEKINELLKNIDPTKQSLGIIPATTWQSKHWNETHWKELLKYLEGKYNIIFIGTDADKPLINRVSQIFSSEIFIDLAGKTTLVDLIELFSRLDIVIGVDTGPIHLAAAVNKAKVIALFGPTSHVRNGAYRHTNLIAEVPCRPCRKKTCPLKDSNHMQCMNKLHPDKVIKNFI